VSLIYLNNSSLRLVPHTRVDMPPFFLISGNNTYSPSSCITNNLVSQILTHRFNAYFFLKPSGWIHGVKNRQLKTMFSNANLQITNISHNNRKAFISGSLHYIQRNVWYRLLHQKLFTRFNLHRITPASVEDKYCPLCKLPGIEQHMLSTCIQK
jgi:hypothetical protein